MQEWSLDLVTTSALTVMLVMLGFQLKHRIKCLERFCVPVAVIGGFTAALLNLVLKEADLCIFHFDTTLQVPAMVAFFTTIGLGGSFLSIRQGGKLLIGYLVICWILVIFQDILGASMASLFGLNPIYGVMAGGVSLQGGHGTAAAFGNLAESLGVQDATMVALACATFGLIAGGLLGGPLASYLIRKHQLTIPTNSPETVKAPVQLYDREENLQLTSYQLIASGGLILVLMTLGFWISGLFTSYFHVMLPTYVGAMFVAIVFRNLNDKFRMIKLNNTAIDVIADLSLGFFLTQATMNLKIWDLYSLALPLTCIVIIQVVLMLLITLYIVFPLMGKDYDAAVMCSGLMGHGLGAVPSAVANMDAVCKDFNAFSYKAFLIVPLSGAVLVDIVGVPFHVWIINYLQ
ncbi:MAG: sodium/glutamate symporter [Legionellales bacterium]|jgi:ESS family glutamate:Na+ symporter